MTSEEFRWLAFVSVLSPLIPLSCLFIYKKGQPRQHRILALSLYISLGFDLASWTASYFHVPLSLNNIYFIVAFPAIMAFYHEVLIKRSVKILVRIFTVIFLIIAIFFLVKQGLYVANTTTWIISSVLVTITSLYFVVDLRLMDDSTFAKTQFHTTNIIINSAVAVYYFSTIILFSMTDYVASNFTAEDFRYFWIFHDAIYVLKNCGIAIAFYLCGKTVIAWSGKQTPN